MTSTGVLLAVCVSCAAGCAAARRPYQAPAVAPPDAWSRTAGANAAAPADAAALAQWWRHFEDPLLTSFVERAARNSLDVRTAQSRLREARASLAATRTTARPSVDVSGSATVSRSSEESGAGEFSDFYRAGFDASWELDVFGRIRGAVRRDVATAQAREADLHDVLVTLAGDVAVQYINVRTFQTRAAIATANAASQEETYQLTRFRAQAGLASELDVEQARSNLESTRAQIASLVLLQSQAAHGLAVLLGAPPASLDVELQPPGDIPVAAPAVAIGVPAESLRRRPDIRSAERQVAARAAQVDVTAADLYPTFSLSGSIGLETLKFARLFVPGATAFSAGPAMSWRVFDRRQIRENVRVQTELQTQAAIAYEATVLGALQEVEDALVALAQEQIVRARLTDAVAAAQEAASLSLLLYESGLRDFRDVLDSQRSLLSLQDQLASSTSNMSTDLVQLYKALGGGWATLPTP